MQNVHQLHRPQPPEADQEGRFLPHLENFAQQVTGVLYTIISTTDGFPVAYSGIDAQQATRQAAMAASLDGLCATLVTEALAQPASGHEALPVDAVTIESSSCFLFSRQLLMTNGANLVLLGAFNKEENLATLQWQIKQLINSLQQC